MLLSPVSGAWKKIITSVPESTLFSAQDIWFILTHLAYRAIAKKNMVYQAIIHSFEEGAQWLSGRVLDSRPKGRRSEPHRRHCVVVLEQDTFILA